MRKFVFFLLTAVCAVTIIYSAKADKSEELLKMYVVDAESMHLIPIDITVRESDAEHQAKSVISALIRGCDENPKIRRLIPAIRGCMSVKVRSNTAYVNITNRMIKNHPEGRDLERLTIYSIVNSLTGIRGIDNVKFTVEGREQKKFMGYADMRAAFTFERFV